LFSIYGACSLRFLPRAASLGNGFIQIHVKPHRSAIACFAKTGMEGAGWIWVAAYRFSITETPSQNSFIVASRLLRGCSGLGILSSYLCPC
ncbi:MAG: hypothetical protein QNI92_17190, partial [Desulfobacterales bacterium]|nr:hypothetical protein [Desulfobacterales bacterium]